VSAGVRSIVTVLVLGGLLLLPGVVVAAEGFMDHGVAAPVSRSRGAAATVDGEGNRVVLIWLADYRSCRTLLVVDVATGEAEQLEVPVTEAGSPFSILLSSDNKWYSLFSSRFLQFDPASRQFTFVGDTPNGMAMGTCEDSEGTVWFGMYPNANLISFDPKTKELTDHGSINKEDWPQYPNYMTRDSEGWIYMGIGSTRVQVVAYNPETKETRSLIPEDQRPQGSGAYYVYRGLDGKAYITVKGWGDYVALGGVATPWEGEMPKAAPMKRGYQDTVLRGFPDGSQLAKLDVPGRQMTVREVDGTERVVNFDYESDGPGILSVCEGPDGAIYGSTGHPLRVYRYDPATGELSNHGLGDMNGHFNAMVTQRDRLYGVMYGYGILYEYDVRQPWADTDKENPNPRELIRSNPDINRPHVLLACPDGRHVIMGGTPDYGLTGGGLHIYDLQEGKGTIIPHTELVLNHSPNCLVTLPDGNLLGGTTTMPGTGGRQLATEAELFIFDWAQRKVVWHEVPMPGKSIIMDLILAPSGLVYGVMLDASMFVFDPATRQIVHREPLQGKYGRIGGSQAPRVMALGADGKIYMLFRNCIVRLDPESYTHEKVDDLPVTSVAGVALVKGRLYFTSESHLCSYGLPGLVAE
jgi:sugar lactone lactonase YvrE